MLEVSLFFTPGFRCLSPVQRGQHGHRAGNAGGGRGDQEGESRDRLRNSRQAAGVVLRYSTRTVEAAAKPGCFNAISRVTILTETTVCHSQ